MRNEAININTNWKMKLEENIFLGRPLSGWKDSIRIKMDFWEIYVSVVNWVPVVLAEIGDHCGTR